MASAEWYFDFVSPFAYLQCEQLPALESKLRIVQEALELVLDVARDRRLVLLEVTIVILILVEILISLTRFLA